MTQIKFVTSNPGKVREIAAKLRPLGFEVVQLHEECPEIQADDYEEVATFALAYLSRKLAPPVMLDDSGLSVDALGGFPGVYSSYVFRTLGNGGILKLLSNGRNRKASFTCCIGYCDISGNHHFFRGITRGRIALSPRGTGGFGFDPIFVPEGSKQTFAELTLDRKNRVSHRAKAIEAFVKWLGREG